MATRYHVNEITGLHARTHAEEAGKVMMDNDRFFARSASDQTDNWPFWYVADRTLGNLNVTVRLDERLRGYMPFVRRERAEALAKAANG